VTIIGLCRISAPALANPKSFFPEIRPSPAPAKCVAGFGECQCICQLITDKNIAADGSNGVFTILIGVTWT